LSWTKRRAFLKTGALETSLGIRKRKYQPQKNIERSRQRRMSDYSIEQEA